MCRSVLALAACLVLLNTALVPDLAAQNPETDQKGDKVTEQVKKDSEGSGGDPVKMGTPKSKLQKFCSQDENKNHDKCAELNKAQ